MSRKQESTDTGGPQPPHRLGVSAQHGSERAKLRRALAFLGMTLVVPGSAQLAAGNRRVGHLALRVWVGLWAAAVLLGLLALVWRGGVVALLTFPPTLRVLQVAILCLAIGWGLLFLDAWRLARPPELARRHRIGFATLSIALSMAVVGGLVASASIVSSQRQLVASVFAGGGDTEAQAGRFNILLLGGDAGKTRVGLRPDSLTVASVDARTGRTVLLSLPRNMEEVPFPAGSPMRERFPRGFTCPDGSCMLNAVYTYATEHKGLYPGVKDPGVQATKEAVEGVTGLKINYYVLVDLKGFESLVDAVGGITLDINKRVPVGGGSTPVKRYIEPGQGVRLEGKDALWFARSRADSSDYERMSRQKCVMSAMLNQLDPVTVLANFNEIAAAGKKIMTTDIPTSDIDTLLELSMKAKEKKLSSVAFVPPLVYPGNPDFAKVRATVQAKIAKSEAIDAPKADAPKADAPAAPTTVAPPVTESPKPKRSKKKAKASTPTPGQDTDDLAEVCAAR